MMARTVGENRAVDSWVFLGALGLLTILQPVACTGNPTPPTVAGDIGAVLEAVGPEVVLPTLSDFRAQLEAQRTALIAWESDLDNNGDTTQSRADTQAAWRATMAIWQQAEVMQLGPAASPLSAVGGQGSRDELYSWPTVNPCRVDQETVEADWDSPDFFSGNLVNSYGLDAVEHLVFAPASNACPGQVDINAEGTWDALGPAGVEQNRVAYALALTDGLIVGADGLIEAWSPDGGDFSGQLAAAGDSAPYGSQLEALNAVYDALFYLELETKDAKLGKPLGLLDCLESACPEATEHLPSGTGADAIAANAAGFRKLFDGGEGHGVDDLLVELGHGDLADSVHAALDDFDVAITAFEEPLQTAVTEDPEAVEALHTKLKAVTDLVKLDLATVLSVVVPNEAAGDND